MFLLYVFVFTFGLVVGSFLNAVIYRLENGDSVFRGRSYCPHCKHILTWYDLIPLASFAMLGGRCRHCKAKISLQYPFVELATGLIFLLIFNFQFLIFNEFSNFLIFKLAYLWIIAGLLVILFVYDLRHYILPDKILFPAIGIAVGYLLFEFGALNHWKLIENWSLVIGNSAPLLNAILSAVAAAAFFFAIFAVSKGAAMGLGDVKLALFMGLFLGWPNILVALFAAFFLGAIVGLGLIALKKKELKSEIPFGPFLIAGTFIALLFGESMVQWYWNNFLV